MRRYLLPGLILSLVIFSGCESRSPKRDQIPILKNKLYDLQTAVKERNRAAIDSLLSVKIISKEQGSDSLLSFVYGPGDTMAFDRFGNYNILYTNDKARIECFVVDSSGTEDRPVVFYLALEGDLWLITSFEEGEIPTDSLATDSQ